jgi:hypothetical protein
MNRITKFGKFRRYFCFIENEKNEIEEKEIWIVFDEKEKEKIHIFNSEKKAIIYIDSFIKTSFVCKMCKNTIQKTERCRLLCLCKKCASLKRRERYIKEKSLIKKI